MGEAKFAMWTKISVEELKAYFGFSILMSINSLPGLKDYWKRDPIFNYAPIAERISRDRFLEISRYLHFVDNETLARRDSPSYDRLGKVRPLVNHFSDKFKEVYSPHKEVAVDEAMIKFTGRSSVKQYMPMKPIKRGIKVWVLADSHNGYFCDFQVYTGKTIGAVEKGLGARVVKDLTNNLKGKYHHTYFDNFFTGVDLLDELCRDGIYACGTARKDRKGFPVSLKKPSLSERCVKGGAWGGVVTAMTVYMQ